MNTHKIPFSIYKGKTGYIIQNLQLSDFFLGTQRPVQNSHGKQAISVRATEVLLYMVKIDFFYAYHGVFCIETKSHNDI